MKQNTISSAPPFVLESNAAPRLFSLIVFYRGLKHEPVTYFNGRDRLLSSWIISEFLKEL